MGLIGKILTGKLAANAMQKAMARREARQAAAGAGEYIPAGARVARGGGTALVDRATGFYRQNPRLVQSLGVAAALIALSALKGRRT